MSRIFEPGHDAMAVARWLRGEAMKGFQRGDDDISRRYVKACTCGVNLAVCPNSVSLILTRDAAPDCVNGWHLSICCVTNTGYRGYVPEEGEHWLNAIFGDYAARAVEQPLAERGPLGKSKDIRHFVIECDWNDATAPAVRLRASDEGCSKTEMAKG